MLSLLCSPFPLLPFLLGLFPQPLLPFPRQFTIGNGLEREIRSGATVIVPSVPVPEEDGRLAAMALGVLDAGLGGWTPRGDGRGGLVLFIGDGLGFFDFDLLRWGSLRWKR